MRKNVKMTKDTVPEGFSVNLALVDFLPVLFFGGTSILLGLILKNTVVVIAAAVTFLSGFIKVLWKIIVATEKKNVWWMFLQMRIIMPLSMIALIAGIAFSIISGKSGDLGGRLFLMPQSVLFIMGILGMCLMGIFASRLDSADPKSNWIEQITNSLAQGCIFAGMLLVYLS